MYPEDSVGPVDDSETESVKVTDRIAELTVKVAALTAVVNGLLRHVHGTGCQQVE